MRGLSRVNMAGARPNGRWLLWLASATLIAAVVITMVLQRSSREARAVITETGGTFHLQSVWVTRGTRHTHIYPSRLLYFTKQAGQFLGLRRLPDAFRIDRTTSVESVGVWIKWNSRDGRLSPRDARGSLSGAPGGRFVAGIADPVRKSGIFLWIGENLTNAISGREFSVKTVEGGATITFP